jgi:RHS repeat-associated protein
MSLVNGGFTGYYRYAHTGLRLPKYTWATGWRVFHYTLDGQLLQETTDQGVLVRAYVWDDEVPIAQIDRNPATGQETLSYLHTDHLQTPRLATDANRQVVWRWEGEAFGNTAPSGSITVNLRFPGQYFDQETGLHYNWHRYYDPRIGRYITSDPIGLRGGLNTYAYAKDNPLRWVDPKGLLNEFPGDTEQVYNPCYFSGTCDSDAMIERMKAEARAAGDCLVCVAKCEAKVLFGAGLAHIAEKQAEKELEKVADRVAKEFLRRGLKFFGWVGAAQTGFDSIRCLVECK